MEAVEFACAMNGYVTSFVFFHTSESDRLQHTASIAFQTTMATMNLATCGGPRK